VTGDVNVAEFPSVAPKVDPLSHLADVVGGMGGDELTRKAASQSIAAVREYITNLRAQIAVKDNKYRLLNNRFTEPIAAPSRVKADLSRAQQLIEKARE
jgi:hypothetical protein